MILNNTVMVKVHFILKVTPNLVLNKYKNIFSFFLLPLNNIKFLFSSIILIYILKNLINMYIYN